MTINNPLDLKNLSLPYIRDFFFKRNIEEVITPLLVKSGGIEPYVEPVSISDGLFLPTSPEISLKKTLALKNPYCKGIYEIAHAFREERQSSIHLKEFTMLEWYKKDSSYLDFSHEVMELLKILSQIDSEYTSEKWNSMNFQILSISEIFKEFYNVDIKPDWDLAEYQKVYLAGNQGYKNNSKPPFLDSSVEVLEIFTFLLDQAMDFFQKRQSKLIFINEFPPFLRGMAKLSTEGWAMRMEAFYQGIELCSGYQEMDDPAELKKIWDNNNAIREKLQKPIHPVDEVLLELTRQMRGVAGMALGLERTLMAIFDIKDIQGFKLDRFF